MIDNFQAHRCCETHCCKVCGCKYGYDDCPVTNNLVEPKYKCWDCEQTDYHGCGEYIRKIEKLEQLIIDITKLTSI